MNKEEFRKELDKLNINYDIKMLEKLDIYKDFLIEYNMHTNLTAITKESDIYLKHFYDSLTITKAVNLNEINKLIDIGTGAGFPGMVLKIFFPHLEVTLLDSNNKKTKFLEQLAEKLNVEVNIINDRVENYSKLYLNSFDLVTSRAVANMRVLSEISLPLVKVGGLFVPLKGRIDIELNDALLTINLMGAKLINEINFELSNDAGLRSIVVYEKLRETSVNEIRTYDKILKKPLKKIAK